MVTPPAGLDPRFWAIAQDGLLARRLGPWAREKLYYVDRYMEIFNAGMRYKWARRVYIDLFSGPGVVIAQQQEIPGSPLLAVRTRVPFTDIFLNDLEPGAIAAVRARYANSKLTSAAHFFMVDCNDAASTFANNFQVAH